MGWGGRIKVWSAYLGGQSEEQRNQGSMQGWRGGGCRMRARQAAEVGSPEQVAGSKQRCVKQAESESENQN